MKHILFVDDEARILDGLKRILHPLRKEWQMVFVTGGEDALRSLSQIPFDVLVTDLRMPGMNGLELLAEVRERYPNVVRIVLSGEVDRDLVLRSVMMAHQYLTKPCDAAALKSVVSRSLLLRNVISDPALKRFISRMHALPTIPAVYQRLVGVLQSPDCTTAQIGETIAQDLALTTKVLQLVNSPFFGLQRQITRPAEAVGYLGTETIKSLALSISASSQFQRRSRPGFSLEQLQNHSLSVASLARSIAKAINLPKNVGDEAFMAGMLHDVGKLVLLSNNPAFYDELTIEARKKGQSFNAAEQSALGTTHAEIGAYLLLLWGLPDTVIEVVLWHHKPGFSQRSTPGALTAVHAANALVNNRTQADLDRMYLAKLSLADQLSTWQRLHRLMPAT